MCFNKKKFQFPSKAKKDIICYKYLIKGKYPRSFYYGKDYIMGKKESIKFKFKEKISKRINIGFHSYKEKELTFLYQKYVYEDRKDTKCYKCIIPQGSRYYENDFEYVSEQIIIEFEK